MGPNQIAGIAQGAFGTLAALGGAIYGGIKSGKYNRKAEKLIQDQRDENKRWYEVKQAEDYTQRSDVQAAIKRQRELLDEQYKKAKAANVVAGGTDEALALQKQAANKALSQTTTDIASQASAYKEGVENQYRQQDAALNQQQAQGYQQLAAATAQAASQTVNKGLGLVGQAFDSTTATRAPEPGEPGYEGWIKQNV